MALVTSADAHIGALVRVSATDKAGNILWYDAKIENIKDGEVLIHYAGYNHEFVSIHRRHNVHS